MHSTEARTESHGMATREDEGQKEKKRNIPERPSFEILFEVKVEVEGESSTLPPS